MVGAPASRTTAHSAGRPDCDLRTARRPSSWRPPPCEQHACMRALLAARIVIFSSVLCYGREREPKLLDSPRISVLLRLQGRSSRL
jgi:hypothetical protein